MGESSKSCLYVSGPGCSRLPLPPRRISRDMTKPSRRGSIAGLVTCSGVWGGAWASGGEVREGARGSLGEWGRAGGEAGPRAVLRPTHHAQVAGHRERCAADLVASGPQAAQRISAATYVAYAPPQGWRFITHSLRVYHAEVSTPWSPHLSESLFEVGVEGVGVGGQHRQGDGVAHAKRWLYSALGHALHYHLGVLQAHACGKWGWESPCSMASSASCMCYGWPPKWQRMGRIRGRLRGRIRGRISGGIRCETLWTTRGKTKKSPLLAPSNEGENMAKYKWGNKG